MIGRIAGHAGQLAASVLVGAVLIGVGFMSLDHQAAPAGALYTPIRSHDSAAAVPSQDDSLTLRVNPHLDAAGPTSGGVPVGAPIQMSFSQPMNRHSVAFNIQPAIEGHLVWRDDFTLSFEPFRLAYATSYQVEVSGRSIRGSPLSGSRWWSFTTESGPANVRPPAASINVPILTYHYIRENPDRNDRLGFALSVTPADFAAQMDWLARNGYQTITTAELHAYLAGTRALPSKPVILTFDDGYADFYTAALPVLRGHGFTAVAYIVSGFVGQPRYMTADQVRESDRSGVEIGSHTVSHPDLTTMPGSSVLFQLRESKRVLEGLVGHPVVSFCYPSGKFSRSVAAAVSAAGFDDATTTRFGYTHTLADRYVWTRLRVSGGESLDQFGVAVSSAS